MTELLHGYKQSKTNANGQLFFAVIKLLQAIEFAQTFPGRNKYPSLIPWSGEQAQRFLLASGKLKDTFWKLDRSAELIDEERRRYVDLKPPSVPVQDIVAVQQANRDIPLFIDSVLAYLKIFADSLANVTSQFYSKPQVPSRSFREQMKWFIKKIDVDAGYTDIVKNNTGWFITLADSNQDGLRDLIVHHMYRMQMFWQPRADSGREPIARLSLRFSIIDRHLPSIQTIVEGLCVFLDRYVEHFATRIEQQWGGSVFNWKDQNSCLLFNVVGELPSRWMYPTI